MKRVESLCVLTGLDETVVRKSFEASNAQKIQSVSGT